MVKLFALAIVHKGAQKANLLKFACDLTSFGFFQRSSAQEFMVFTSNIIVERTHTTGRQSVKEKEFLCHVFVRADNLAGVVISDHDYPHRVAHSLLTKVLDDFAAKVPADQWPGGTEETISYPGLEIALAKYQDPREADSLYKINDELEETKIILHKTIESVLQRGEKLDDLVSKSEGLSSQSKIFYKTARKTNSCCNLG